MVGFPRTASLIATILAAPFSSQAATINFNDLPPSGSALGGYDRPYTQNGITATAFPHGDNFVILGGYTTPGTAHLDDAGPGYARGITFTTGSPFDVLRFSFISLGFNFYADIYDGLGEEIPQVVGNIVIRGFLEGKQISRDRLSMSPIAGTAQSVELGAAFSGLDAFSIELVYPEIAKYCDAPCAHIDLDSVTFDKLGPAPIPLPASGLLLGMSAMALVAAGRRKRSYRR